MTKSEAIKELHEIRPRGGIIPQKRAEAIDVAINALEKQIPKKPIIETNRYTTLFICPSCGRKQGIKYKQYHCIECGQKLDWSEEE